MVRISDFLSSVICEDPVVLLSVAAESGPLFELHVAALHLALVGVVLRVDIHVLHQVLLLGERPVAHLTHVLLDSAVDRDEMSFETKSAGELFVAAGHRADVDALVLLVNLALDHLVVDLQVLLLHLAVVLAVLLVFVVRGASHFPILVLVSSRDGYFQ